MGASNAGMDPTDVLNKLRMKHATGGTWFGVDVIENGVCDTFEKFAWEATVMKRNALAAATEAACLILSVDETVRNPQSEKPDAANYQGMGSARARAWPRARPRPRPWSVARAQALHAKTTEKHTQVGARHPRGMGVRRLKLVISFLHEEEMHG